LKDPAQTDVPQAEKATRVTFKDKADKVLSDLLIGKEREPESGFGGHYVMPLSDSRIYLVDADFKDIGATPEKWLKKDLLDVPAAQVSRVVCEDAQGKVIYTAARPEKGKEPAIDNPPADKKPVPAKLNDLFGALTAFTIDDVADPASPADKTGLGSSPRLNFHLFDGTVYTLSAGKSSGGEEKGNYLTVKVSFVAPPDPPKAETPAKTGTDAGAAPAAPVQGDAASATEKAPAAMATGSPVPEPAAEKKPDAAKPAADAPTPETLAREAEKRNQEISPWIFIVPKWKTERLITDAASFFEAPKPPETGKPPAPQQ